jgi:putative transcriptional regulator
MKKKNKVYKSDISAVVHETASDYYAMGIIDKQTMRHFDMSCLTPVHEFTAKEIIALRKREEVSQVVLSRYLNVSKESISKWERGEKRPAGTSLKLLSLAEKNGLAAIA